MLVVCSTDVDECVEGSHECTGSLMHCVNRPGTYICQCRQGFQMNHAARVCEGISEMRLFRKPVWHGGNVVRYSIRRARG